MVNFKKELTLLSNKLWLMKNKIPNLYSAIEMDRIIEMAWEDRTPFEAIQFQFNCTESEVIDIMRSRLKRSSFNLWRKRVNSGISQKHLLKRNPEITRFKCNRQRTISSNKISKR
jgi:uncharacterized protein (TIGR03643 family)